MAWRPTQYLLEGELDNTTPGKVTGWMRFAGMQDKVTFNLEGNFHRDIRGAKIHFTGNGDENDPQAAGYMSGFSTEQTGKVGDITAGLPPADYVKDECYIEWYGEDNGRVVIELEQDQVQVIGKPIPACESDPITREEQAGKMAEFLAGVSSALKVKAVAVGPNPTIVSDPQFTHWVVEQGYIVGEARDVKPESNGTSFAYVRLFKMADFAEYGSVPNRNLRLKNRKED